MCFFGENRIKKLKNELKLFVNFNGGNRFLLVKNMLKIYLKISC